jgi:AcrR family transcriptional regulator
MNIEARHIRAIVEDIPGLRPVLSPRQEQMRGLILQAAVATFAALGRRRVTMRALAKACWMSRDRIEFHFLDLDCLLSEILHVHLQGLSRALGAVPKNPRERRAAYYAYTRGGLGGLTKEHAVLIFERHHLPPDLLPTIEKIRSGFGHTLCPENPARALDLLDNPSITLDEIEFLLAQPAAKTQPKPALDLANAADADLAAQCARTNRPADQPPHDQPKAPPAAAIPHLASPVRPPFSQPPAPPRSKASLLTHVEDPLSSIPVFQQARAAPT